MAAARWTLGSHVPADATVHRLNRLALKRCLISSPTSSGSKRLVVKISRNSQSEVAPSSSRLASPLRANPAHAPSCLQMFLSSLSTLPYSGQQPCAHARTCPHYDVFLVRVRAACHRP